MINIKTNLFSLAQKRLQKEVDTGIIPCYTFDDVLEYAIFFRKQIDLKERRIKILMQLTPEEKRKINNQKRREFYLQIGR